MFKVENFLTNDDVQVLGESGPFTIIQYRRDLSVTPGQAAFAWYCDQMNIRRRQVVCDLSKGDVCIQPGAMQWMAGNVRATTGIKGAGDFLGKMIRGKMTNESAIKPEYEGDGLLVLEPTYKFLCVIDVSQWPEGIVLDDGLFLACSASLSQHVTTRKSLSAAALGGVGLFSLALRGKGSAVFTTPVAQEELIEVELENDELRVDGPLAIAWSGSLSFTVEKTTGTLLGSAASQEGLVNVYRGTGRVLLCPFRDEPNNSQQPAPLPADAPKPAV